MVGREEIAVVEEQNNDDDTAGGCGSYLVNLLSSRKLFSREKFSLLINIDERTLVPASSLSLFLLIITFSPEEVETN